MAPRWTSAKATLYVQAVADLGMTISHDAATRLIDRHVTLVATQLAVTTETARRYVDDEAIRAIAASEVARHSDEAPGETITLLPADCDVPVAAAGEIILALLAALEPRPDGQPAEIRAESLIQAAAAVAYFQSQLGTTTPPGTVRIPQALLRRCSRYIRVMCTPTTKEAPARKRSSSGLADTREYGPSTDPLTA